MCDGGCSCSLYVSISVQKTVAMILIAIIFVVIRLVAHKIRLNDIDSDKICGISIVARMMLGMILI